MPSPASNARTVSPASQERVHRVDTGKPRPHHHDVKVGHRAAPPSQTSPPTLREGKIRGQCPSRTSSVIILVVFHPSQDLSESSRTSSCSASPRTDSLRARGGGGRGRCSGRSRGSIVLAAAYSGGRHPERAALLRRSLARGRGSRPRHGISPGSKIVDRCHVVCDDPYRTGGFRAGLVGFAGLAGSPARLLGGIAGARGPHGERARGSVLTGRRACSGSCGVPARRWRGLAAAGWSPRITVLVADAPPELPVLPPESSRRNAPRPRPPRPTVPAAPAPPRLPGRALRARRRLGRSPRAAPPCRPRR